jgi:hypothetical protein
MSELRFWLCGSEAASAATALTEALESDAAATTPASFPAQANLKTIDPRERCSLIVSVPSMIMDADSLADRMGALQKAKVISTTARRLRKDLQVEIYLEAGGYHLSMRNHLSNKVADLDPGSLLDFVERANRW